MQEASEIQSERGEDLANSQDDDRSRKMSAWTVGVVQLVFVIVVIASAVGFSSALKGKENANRPQLADLRGASKIAVHVTQPERLRYQPQVRVNGTVQASAEVAVSPQVSGEITRVSPSFRVGSSLKRGDLLFAIDRADFVLAVERAEAEIAAARSDLAQLEAEAQLAIREWQELYPDREVNPLAAREPQIEAAKARLSSAIANQRTAELSLRRTRVLSPVDARVLSSNLDIGQIVSPGQAVGRLVSTESIELVVPVSQDQQGVLEPIIDRVATYNRRGLAAEQKTATVVRVDASLDARTRLSNLFLRPDEQTDLRIGDFVDVALTADVIDGAMSIPSSALTGQDTVWVVDNSRLTVRKVARLGERAGGDEIVVAPFDIAAGVVVLPPLEAEPGQEVSIRSNIAAASASGGMNDAAE